MDTLPPLNKMHVQLYMQHGEKADDLVPPTFIIICLAIYPRAI